MNYLELEHLHLSYGTAPAVKDLNLSVSEGELISLLGPSGCGKTTTMRSIAGLLAPQSGRIMLAGQDITHLPANKRDIGLVFQSYALFPHLTAFENVAFGLRLRQIPELQLRERVTEALRVVGLSDFMQRLPANMSGGQQQRVALARAFVIQPRLLLLDEPLSNLDAKLRIEMRSELRRLQKELGVTMLYVTHDQEEALALSDRIIVMRAGVIEQQGPPHEVYARPQTPFVANFMGWENILRADQVPLEIRPPASQATHFAWRPESVRLSSEHLAGQSLMGQPLLGRVLARNYLGGHQEYLLSTPVGQIKALVPVDATWQENEEVEFYLPIDAAAPLREA